MKKEVNIFFVFGLIFILSLSFVSAGWFSDIYNSITGKAVAAPPPIPEVTCTDSDSANNIYIKGIVTGISGDIDTDECYMGENKVLQFRCGDDGESTSRAIAGGVIDIRNCPNGYVCSDGACIKNSECTTDSDCPFETRKYCSGGNACSETIMYKCVQEADIGTCVKSNTSSSGACHSCSYGCEGGVCKTGKTVDGCKYLTSEIIEEMKDRIADGDTVIIKELDESHNKNYVVVPGYLLRLSSVKNYTTGFNHDIVRFTDVFTGIVFDTTWLSEGKGTIAVGGKVYTVYLQGNSANTSEEYIVKLDFPQTSVGDIMVFEDCKVDACTDSDGGKNPYVFGTMTTTFGGDTIKYSDQCLDDVKIYNESKEYNEVYSCSGDECYVREAFCNYNLTNGSVIIDPDNHELIQCPTGCRGGKCVTLLNATPVECKDLVEKVKNPESFFVNDLGFIYHESNINPWEGTWWIDGQEERGIEYTALWSANYDNEYYNLKYYVTVFENKKIDLQKYLKTLTEWKVCQVEGNWHEEEENKYYICNYDILNNRQSYEDYDYQNRQILWANNNVLVLINTYNGRSLTDEEIAKISGKKLTDFVNKLTDNSYDYVDWENFNLDYPLRLAIGDSLQQCPSEIPLDECSPCWSCKTEPIICPPHGIQTTTCKDQCCGNSNKVDTSSCSPGMCSGCYTPRWMGSSENKCIQYGFRFAQEESQKEKLREGIDYDGDGNIEVEVRIINSQEAYLKITGANFNEDPKEIVFEEFLQIGREYKIDFTDYGEGVFYFRVEDIIISEEEGQSYVLISMGREVNAYCDIDGVVKLQKTKDYNGGWAKCQNSFECESNLCSSGECIELVDMIQDASRMKSMGVRVLCRFADLFGMDNYENCIYDFLGVQGDESPGTDSGGGSSSS